MYLHRAPIDMRRGGVATEHSCGEYSAGEKLESVSTSDRARTDILLKLIAGKSVMSERVALAH